MTRASVQQRRWNLDGSHAEGSLISHCRGLICPVITRGDTQPSSILTTSKTWRLNYYSVDCAVVDTWWFIHQRHNQLLGTWDVGILQPFCRSPSGTKKTKSEANWTLLNFLTTMQRHLARHFTNEHMQAHIPGKCLCNASTMFPFTSESLQIGMHLTSSVSANKGFEN